jgi:3-deoxy-D-manno-octulosonate 8-phosphate phosphatase KdsC-like HAD superfamily phosphatase
MKMTGFIIKKELNISLIVFDFDGVLTDNRVLVLDDGREAVFATGRTGWHSISFAGREFPR